MPTFSPTNTNNSNGNANNNTNSNTNTNSNINTNNGPVCGDGVRQGAERCDGLDLGGADCTDQGFEGGVLACSPECDAFDTSRCNDSVEECGNGSSRAMKSATAPIWEGLAVRRWVAARAGSPATRTAP